MTLKSFSFAILLNKPVCRPCTSNRKFLFCQFYHSDTSCKKCHERSLGECRITVYSITAACQFWGWYWISFDAASYQPVSRMQNKVEVNLPPQSGRFLREATNLISYFPPLWQDTNSDIKQCPPGLSNTGGGIIAEKQQHTGERRENLCSYKMPNGSLCWQRKS